MARGETRRTKKRRKSFPFRKKKEDQRPNVNSHQKTQRRTRNVQHHQIHLKIQGVGGHCASHGRDSNDVRTRMRSFELQSMRYR